MLSMLDNAWDFIQTGIHELLSDCASKGISFICTIYTQILNCFIDRKGNSSYVNAMFNNPLFVPIGQGQNEADRLSAYYVLKEISETFILPWGIAILEIILMVDFVKMINRADNYKNFDTTVFIQWLIRSVIGLELLSHSFWFVELFFTISSSISISIADKLNTDMFKAADSLHKAITQTDAEDFPDNPFLGMTIPDLFFQTLLIWIAAILMIILFAVIFITVFSRFMEACMYFTISPITMSTVLSEKFGGIGQNWLQSVFALAFQIVFVMISLTIYSSIFLSIISSIGNTSVTDNLTLRTDGIIIKLLLLAACTGTLIFTILRSGSISKSIFNAH